MKRLQWIIDREIDEKSNPSNQIGQFKFFKTKDLHNHYGCVNALCVSQEGYLVTSGDDLRVLLYKPSVFYDLDEDGDGENSPHLKSSFTGHVSNVFCVAANPATTKLYSCGNDGFLIFYDVVTGRSETRLAHEDACMRLSLHPTNEHVLLSASQDFSIRLWDSRSSSEEGILIPRRLSTGILLSRNRSMQNYVEFNPTNPNEFVTSDATSGIFLWDIRNAFSCSTTLRNQIHSLVPPLVTFTTRQVKKNPRKDSIMISKLIDISSAVFSKDGKYICANIQKSCPVLYDKDLVDPIAVFDDPGWYSLATIKIGCFSDSIPGASAHYFGGSDNGTTYGFEIPPEFELLENQEKSKFQSTLPLSFSPTFLNKDSREYIIPFSVSSQYELKSGNSIINSCVSHPTDSIIVSAGIEKSVHLFSSIKELPITEKKKVNQDPRTQESRVTLNLFSRLIQQERASLERNNAADWNQLVEIDNALQELIEDDMIGDDTIEDDTDSLQDHSSTSMSS